MKKLKRALSIVLTMCIVLGAVLINSSALVGSVERVEPMDNLLGSRGVHVVGQKTVIDYEKISDGAEFEVELLIYIDRSTYEFFDLSYIKMDFDREILQYAGFTSTIGTIINDTIYNSEDDFYSIGLYQMDISTANNAGADGYCGKARLFFTIKDAEAFLALSPETGTAITLDATSEFSVREVGAAVGTVVELDRLDPCPIYNTDIVVTYEATTVTYDANEGTGTVPNPEPAVKGADYTVLGGITLTKTIDGVNNVLDGWLFEGNLLKAGDKFRMPDENVTLVAQYTPDANGDGIADRDEHTITYALRGGDEAVLDFSASTTHGSFYNVVANTSAVISIEKGTAIGNAAPTVEGTNSDWSLIGFYVAGTKIDNIATYVPTGDITIEIRMKLDENDDGKDDREDVTTVIPGPIVTAEDEEPKDELEIDLKDGAWVLYRGVNKAEVTRVKIDYNAMVAGQQTLTNPVLGSHVAIPAKYQGNAFKTWIFSGPETISEVVYYYIDAVYEPSIAFKIVDNEGNDVFEEDVPSNSTYEIYDEAGNLIGGGSVKGNDDITLPVIPAKNDDGEYFTGWEVTGEDTDGDGVDDKFVIAPAYEMPDEDDVDVIPGVVPPGDEDNSVDSLTGDGVTVLSGAWKNESTATVQFFLRIAGQPADAKDLGNISVSAETAYGFSTYPIANYGTLGNVRYSGKKTVDGKEYGIFEVSFNAKISGIVRVSLSYNAKDAVVSQGYVIVTIGDANTSGKITLSDYLDMLRVINEIMPTPQKGSAGAFKYEIMNSDKKDRISLSDALTVQRMINEVITSN